MKIALIGYGKMGKAIEQVALSKGDEIVLKISIDNTEDFTTEALQKADVAIEFSSPESAFDNVVKCLKAGIPVVCGSTGWLAKKADIEKICTNQNGTFLYASNFSIGVNIFFQLNTYLAKMMRNIDSYEASIKEIHHTEKKDQPSGTAITLAEQIISHSLSKKTWVNDSSNAKDTLSVVSERIDPAPGTHHILYHSAIDDIEIIHTAHTRLGFAQGAVLAAHFLKDKKGIFTMQDLLNFPV